MQAKEKRIGTYQLQCRPRGLRLFRLSKYPDIEGI